MIVIFSNSAGELQRETVNTPEEARDAILRMLDCLPLSQRRRQLSHCR
jgi:hypothetical protein